MGYSGGNDVDGLRISYIVGELVKGCFRLVDWKDCETQRVEGLCYWLSRNQTVRDQGIPRSGSAGDKIVSQGYPTEESTPRRGSAGDKIVSQGYLTKESTKGRFLPASPGPLQRISDVAEELRLKLGCSWVGVSGCSVEWTKLKDRWHCFGVFNNWRQEL